MKRDGPLLLKFLLLCGKDIPVRAGITCTVLYGVTQ